MIDMIFYIFYHPKKAEKWLLYQESEKLHYTSLREAEDKVDELHKKSSYHECWFQILKLATTSKSTKDIKLEKVLLVI